MFTLCFFVNKILKNRFYFLWSINSSTWTVILYRCYHSLYFLLKKCEIRSIAVTPQIQTLRLSLPSNSRSTFICLSESHVWPPDRTREDGPKQILEWKGKRRWICRRTPPADDMENCLPGDIVISPSFSLHLHLHLPTPSVQLVIIPSGQCCPCQPDVSEWSPRTPPPPSSNRAGS